MPSNTLVNIPEEMEEQKTNPEIECRVKTNHIQHDVQSIHLLKCAELYRLFFFTRFVMYCFAFVTIESLFEYVYL